MSSPNFRAVSLPEGVPGTLWLSGMPGRWQAWADFEAQARRIKLALTLCLTEHDEIDISSPAYSAALERGHMPGRWHHVPVRNFAAPSDVAAFHAAIEAVIAALHAGEAVLVHCAAGVGRTGTAAACVLKRLGLPSAESLDRVRDAGSDPAHAIQSGLIDRF